MKFLNYLDKLLAWVLIFLMAAIVIDVSWQVLSRFIVGKPSSLTEEIARFLLIWIGLLGSALAFRKHAHLGLDIVTSKLTDDARFIAELVGQSISFVFAGWVMVYGGIELVQLQLNLGQTSAALEIKMGYVYAVIPLAGLLICVYAIDNLRTARHRVVLPLNTDPID